MFEKFSTIMTATIEGVVDAMNSLHMSGHVSVHGKPCQTIRALKDFSGIPRSYMICKLFSCRTNLPAGAVIATGGSAVR